MTSTEKEVHNQSNLDYKLMVWMYKIVRLFSTGDAKVADLGIQAGQLVVDFGCGPGRYIPALAKIVGAQGKVYAADIHEIAMAEVGKLVQKLQLKNVEIILVDGYQANIPDSTADFVLALDMFHQIQKPLALLNELHRILKKEGTLILEDGHQPREKTRTSLLESKLFEIIEETKSHLKCRPV